MTNEQFRAWLKGFFELSPETTVLVPEQVQVIVNHLNLAEHVAEHLDETNHQIRTEINAFRNGTRRTPDEFKVFTQTVKNLLFND